MIIGIGIDIVRIERIQRWLSQEKLLKRCFDTAELEHAEKYKYPEESLAACYAAKEAFAKALGTGLYGLSMQDILLRRNTGGAPSLQLQGEAKRRFEALAGQNLYVSLTHEKEYACAVVIIEG